MLQLHVLALCLGWALSLSLPIPIILSMIAVRVITEDILALFYFHFQSDLISVLMHPLLLQFSTKEKVHSALFPVFTMCVCIVCKGKDKAIPVQACYMPIWFGEVEAPRFKDMKVVRLSALCTICPYNHRKYSYTRFC
jgi:hypothetical protein